jgi:hypothetical protein
MKAVLVGALAFTIGAASAPRAANRNEHLALLCKRFQQKAGLTVSLADAGLSDLSRGKPLLDAKHPEPAAKAWNPIELEQFAEKKATWVSLSTVQSIFCDE